MFALNIEFGYRIAVSIVYFLMVSYCCFVMEKVPFYRKKSFWTMLISILTALSVYFAASCTRKVFFTLPEFIAIQLKLMFGLI